ncbi:MAG: class I SAM-dependent methyltransferase [Candidatus Eiseniibacteriota bacterium]
MTEIRADVPQVVPTREGYDLWARIYDDEDNPLISLEAALFAELLGDVRGLRVADLGCGTGRQALARARAGAHVVAADFSEGMLARARAKRDAADIRFLRHDITRGLPFADGAFDRVTCCLVLEHVADLGPMMREMARVCGADGRVLVSELHPAMRLLDVQAQFTDPSTGIKTRPAAAGHVIADYVMAAERAGLKVEWMSEHAVDEALVTRSPRAAKYLGWPLRLLLKLCKAGA